MLEKLGLPIPLDEQAAARALRATGFTFLFAPYYHPAMKAIAPVRAALGVRTIFNVLGPLANPAQPPLHVIGAYSLEMAQLMAQTLSGLDIERVFVIHGAEHWDEPTPIGPFTLFDVRPGNVAVEVRSAGGLRLQAMPGRGSRRRGCGTQRRGAARRAVRRGPRAAPRLPAAGRGAGARSRGRREAAARSGRARGAGHRQRRGAPHCSDAIGGFGASAERGS